MCDHRRASPVAFSSPLSWGPTPIGPGQSVTGDERLVRNDWTTMYTTTPVSKSEKCAFVTKSEQGPEYFTAQTEFTKEVMSTRPLWRAMCLVPRRCWNLRLNATHFPRMSCHANCQFWQVVRAAHRNC